MFSPAGPCGSEQKSMKMRKATQAVKLDAAGLHVTSKIFADICLQLVCTSRKVSHDFSAVFAEISPLWKCQLF